VFLTLKKRPGHARNQKHQEKKEEKKRKKGRRDLPDLDEKVLPFSARSCSWARKKERRGKGKKEGGNQRSRLHRGRLTTTYSR